MGKREFVIVCSCQVLSCFFFQFVFGGCWSCPACQLALVLVEATACMCPDKCEAATWINHCPPFMLAFGVYVDSILIDVWCVCGCMAACYVAPMEWGQNELWKADGWVSEGGMLCNMQKPYKTIKNQTPRRLVVDISRASNHETYRFSEETPPWRSCSWDLLGPGRCGESPRGHWVNRCGC